MVVYLSSVPPSLFLAVQEMIAVVTRCCPSPPRRTRQRRPPPPPRTTEIVKKSRVIICNSGGRGATPDTRTDRPQPWYGTWLDRRADGRKAHRVDERTRRSGAERDEVSFG